MPCFDLGSFPSSNSGDLALVKRFKVWWGSDLHLGIQTTGLLRGEKQSSILSTAGEGSGLLCVLIYSLSGWKESCSRSFASCYM